jgi:hypothetical protein
MSPKGGELPPEPVSVVSHLAYCVSDAAGDVEGAHGLFFRDTRHLSRLVLLVGGERLAPRSSLVRGSAGEFEVEHREFLLFPTYVHQNLKMLKPEAHEGFQAHAEEPKQIRMSAAGVVTDILQLESRARMDVLEDEHVWTAPLIDMRFNYRPENPLYLLLVRAYRLRKPVTVENTPAYAGCKSWVPLGQPVATGGAAAVLDDVKYESRRRVILDRLAGAVA